MGIPLWGWKALTGGLGVATVGLGVAVVVQNKTIKKDSDTISQLQKLIGEDASKLLAMAKENKELQTKLEGENNVRSIVELTKDQYSSEGSKPA